MNPLGDVRAELVGTVAEICVALGDELQAGTPVVVLESMKMEIPVLAECSGSVGEIAVSVGTVVQEGDLLVRVVPSPPDPG